MQKAGFREQMFGREQQVSGTAQRGKSSTVTAVIAALLHPFVNLPLAPPSFSRGEKEGLPLYGVAGSLFFYLDQLWRMMTADVTYALIPFMLAVVATLVVGVLALKVK
jgi:hypothetical protein